MNSPVIVGLLRALLVGAFAVITLLQVIALPWLSGVMAQDYPAEAHMRWPMLTFAVLGLACVQVVIICTLRLLGFTVRNEVFSPRALRWVDGIVAALLAASLVCLTAFVYHCFAPAGPPLWMMALLAGVFLGVGTALLMRVMRTLLVQATTLRSELDSVI